MENKVEYLKQQYSATMNEGEAIKQQLLEAIAERFNKHNIEEAEKALESSTDYGSDDMGIYQWLRFNPEKFGINVNDFLEREAFENYLEDTSISIDWSNEVLTSWLGPCIIINDDGDVLDEDSGKWIISKKDYETKAERNKLIEEYMEGAGYFPGCFYMDSYGNVYPVSTIEKGE